MKCCLLGVFTIPAGKKGTFSFEVSCKKINGGYYIIVITGLPKDGNYVEDGDREILTLDNVEMGSGTQADIKMLCHVLSLIPKCT